MTKSTDKVQKTTLTPHEQRLQYLKCLFPECVTEGEIDTEQLVKLLNISGGGMGLMNTLIFTVSHGQVNVKPSVSSTPQRKQRSTPVVKTLSTSTLLPTFS